MDHRQLGQSLAQLLVGAWRATSQPGTQQVVPFVGPLLAAGTGGLVGRNLPLVPPRPLRPLREEYRAITRVSVERERLLVALLPLLERAGAEPLLIKGLSVSRFYPDAGCRPPGDIDLCVRPGTLSAAMMSLLKTDLPLTALDLHEGVPDLKERRWDDLVRRSVSLPVGGTSVRVLGPEDLLRLVCLHFVRHLGERPLWLCDVAVLLESLPTEFDWKLCLAGTGSQSRWVLAIVSLACQLLQAVPRVQPPQMGVVPCWLVNSVLNGWGQYVLRRQTNNTFNPIRAAWRLGVGPINSVWLIQLGSLLLRPVQGLVRLARLWTPRSPALPFQIHQERHL